MCAWSYRGGIEARRCGRCVALLRPGNAASPRRLRRTEDIRRLPRPRISSVLPAQESARAAPHSPFPAPAAAKGLTNTLDFASKAVRQQGAPAPVG